jgi:outer membrane protein assembly factor BamB
MRCRLIRAFVFVPLACLTLLVALDSPSQAGKPLSAKISPLNSVFKGTAGSNFAFEWPDRFALDSKGNLIVLDPKQSTVFKLDPNGKVLWSTRSAPPYVKRFDLLEDVAVDASDQVWVLDAGHKLLCSFTPEGQVSGTVAFERTPRRFTVTSEGELVVNGGLSHSLFDVYSQEGKLLRSFGKRESYRTDTMDYELNTGNMAAGPHGEVYISLASPPVIRAYAAASGKLLWQADIPFFPPLKAPDIQTKSLPNGQVGANFDYQIASLDLAVDRQGRLLCLVGGMNRALLREGSKRLDLYSAAGQRLGSVDLPVAAVRLASRRQSLFLLEDHNTDFSLTHFSFNVLG